MKHIDIFSSVSEYETAKSGGTLITPNVSFVDEDSSVRYLLKLDFTHNGYEYVDLGLPSGLKWATCNVGATSPEEYGLYFAWGETTGYTAEQVTSGEKLFDNENYTASWISSDLISDQDAAHVNLGGNWRMPTKDEYQELIDNCNVEWTTNYNQTGVAGQVFTSKVNGNSVFFPAAGFCNYLFVETIGSGGQYWSASFDESSTVWYFGFYSNHPIVSNNERYIGQSVRGVFK